MNTKLPVEGLIQAACNLGVPRHMAAHLVAYVVNRRPPPSEFLTAILCNDLLESVKHADNLNAQCLPAYVNFMHRHAPAESWGSSAHFMGWITPFLESQNKLIEGLETWAENDQTRARSEGWELKPGGPAGSDGQVGRAAAPAAIVKYAPPADASATQLDASLNFADDKAAHLYVATRATAGSPFHARALRAIGDDVARHQKAVI